MKNSSLVTSRDLQTLASHSSFHFDFVSARSAFFVFRMSKATIIDWKEYRSLVWSELSVKNRYFAESL